MPGEIKAISDRGYSTECLRFALIFLQSSFFNKSFFNISSIGGVHLLGFSILTGFFLLGSLLHTYLHVPLPANVIGLILFTLSLFLKVIKLEWVEDAGEFLIRHMLLFFIPFVVGTMVFLHYIGQHAMLMLVSLFVSTFGVLLITGWSVRLFKRKADEQVESP
jgi:holin-like protein